MLDNRAGVVRRGDAGGRRVVRTMDGCAEVCGGTSYGRCGAFSAAAAGRPTAGPATVEAYTAFTASTEWTKGKLL